MAPRMKFNPRTGRYESVTPTPTPTPTTLPARQYAPNDTRGDTRPKAPTARATTTTTTPKKKTPTPVSPSTTVKPRYTNMIPDNVPTSTTVPTGPVASSRGGKQNQQQTSGARVSSLNKPNIADYNVPPDLSTTDLDINGVPDWLQQFLTGGGGTSAAETARLAAAKDANSYRAGMGAADIQRQAGVRGQQQYGTLADTSYGSAMKNIADLYNPQVTSTGEFYDKQLADLPAYYDAQNVSTNEFYDKQKAAAEAYYAGQGTTATGTIDAATADLLANLKGTNAYTDVQGSNIAAPTQGLSDVLKAYGGTGQAASEQQAMDAATSKAIADLFTRSNKQLAGAEADYYTGLQNAARGAQGASKQQLATNIAMLQGQDVGNINAARRTDLGTSAAQRRQEERDIATGRRTDLSGLAGQRTTAEQGAETLRQQLLGQGIESLTGGEQTAAATEAQTTATYGKPKEKAKPQIIKKAENLAAAPKNPKKGQVWKKGPQNKDWSWNGKNWVAK